jgi:integrase
MSGELHLEPSTLKGYRHIRNFHGKDSEIAAVRVPDFTNPMLTHQVIYASKHFYRGSLIGLDTWVRREARSEQPVAACDQTNHRRRVGRWHEFRRGLATSWYYLDEAKTVQAILCHANVSTTMAHYVIADPAEQRAAISKLDGVPDCLWNLKKGT